MLKRWMRNCLLLLVLVFSVGLMDIAVVAEGDNEDIAVDVDTEEVSLEDYELFFLKDGAKTAEYSEEYSGNEIRPDVVLVNRESGEELYNDDQNYVVEYCDNVNAGTASVTITGQNNYTGRVSAEFTIYSKSLDTATLKLSYTTYTYNGKARKPAVTVIDEGKTLEKDVDYTVSYSNNTNIGTAKVTVDGKGNYTGTRTATFTIKFGTPKITSTIPTYNSITVKWSEVVGASKYVIYRSTKKDSGYKKVETITDTTVRSFKDKGLTTGTTYYYKVRAYNGTKYTISGAKSQRVQPYKATISSVDSQNYNTVKITWKKVAGASGYVIYRSTSENGTYTKLGKVKGGNTLSYKSSGLDTGRTYYFKVRAYRTENGTNYYGYASTASAGKAVPSRVKINTSIQPNLTSVTLKWEQIAGATGYEIYRSTDKSSGYSRVKTITSGSTLSWKNTGLKANTMYYYKVRAYRTVNDKKVYGSFSKVYTKPKCGWVYVKGYKLYYNKKGNLVKDVSKIIGKQSSYVIKVNKKKNVVTVYAKDGSNGYIIPVKSFICSTGNDTPIGTFYTPAKYRWLTLMGPCWGQWCTGITGNILFHSVFYNSPNNNMTLSVSAYNKLGTTCSHGCVRLTAGDAKWIYDNCKLNTKVIIYNSSYSGPFGKPTAYKLPSWHTWDPTDPNAKKKCAEKGCH